MAGDLKGKLIASSSLTVTALHSLASSQDWSAGWFSGSFNNTSNNYDDMMFGGTFTTHASNRQAGKINIYVVGALNDTPNWPPSSSGTPGTEGTGGFTDLEERDSVCALLDSIDVDNTASAVYTLKPRWCAHLFGGRLPPYFGLFVSQNCSTTTTAGLAASGSVLYATPAIDQYT